MAEEIFHDSTEKEKSELTLHQSMEGTSVVVETAKDNLRKKTAEIIENAQSQLINELKKIATITMPNVLSVSPSLEIDEIEEKINGNIVITAVFNDSSGIKRSADFKFIIKSNEAVIPTEDEVAKSILESKEVEIDETKKTDTLENIADDAYNAYAEGLKQKYPESVLQEIAKQAGFAGLVEDSKENIVAIPYATAPKSFNVNKIQLPAGLKIGDTINLAGLQYKYSSESEDNILSYFTLVD